MTETAGDLQPPGAEGQQPDAGDGIRERMDLQHVSCEDEETDDKRRDAHQLRVSTGRHGVPGWLPSCSASSASYSSSDSNSSASRRTRF
jgi:hypothetical protein